MVIKELLLALIIGAVSPIIGMGQVSDLSSTIGQYESVDPEVIHRSWSRIAEDVRATTGRQLVVEVQPGSDGWWDINAYLDGKKVQGGGRVLSAENEEEFVAELADSFREQFLDEEIWGGWPTCPHHGTHPLEPRVGSESIAAWFCPRGAMVSEIGRLEA